MEVYLGRNEGGQVALCKVGVLVQHLAGLDRVHLLDVVGYLVPEQRHQVVELC